MAFLGMGMNAVGGAMQGMQQPTQPTPPMQEDPVAKLTQLKTLLDQGLITEDDYNQAKAKLLGL